MGVLSLAWVQAVILRGIRYPTPKPVRKTELGHREADFLADHRVLKKSLLPGSSQRVNFGSLCLTLFFE